MDLARVKFCLSNLCYRFSYCLALLRYFQRLFLCLTTRGDVRANSSDAERTIFSFLPKTRTKIIFPSFPFVEYRADTLGKESRFPATAKIFLVQALWEIHCTTSSPLRMDFTKKINNSVAEEDRTAV